jgi:hypothetical protein
LFSPIKCEDEYTEGRKEGRKEEACGAPEAVAPPPPSTSFPPSFINHNHHHQKPKRNNIRLLYIKKN